MSPDHSSTQPPGAHWDGAATTFRVRSAHATAVELQLESSSGASRVPLARVGGDAWEARVDGASPGTRYGYRVSGPWAPALGHLFNPRKLLLDPWARMIDGQVRWHPVLQCGIRTGSDLLPSADDSAPMMPRAVVADASPPASRLAPHGASRDTIIYECHVKGMTALHPRVPASLRGTYLGLASDPVIEHFHRLGVTAVELMPIHPACDSARLVREGLANYWGYDSLAFFAPDQRFATAPGRERIEFREMVERLHHAGLEVILDVVFNHSGEGGIDGCTATFRGFDNATWYRLRQDGGYEDFTGCGNTLDFRRVQVQEMTRDALRHWVTDMGVDGFRFDLAPTLGRNQDNEPAMPFLEALAADQVLAGVRLIAEPWDLGPDGYRQGHFPRGWAEWNGRYRDAVRRFWKGTGSVGELATRLAGSSDLFAASGRPPTASVNYITCHDGFTLHDLVSYNHKHNAANGEGNRDGSDHADSWNHGVEGPTGDTGVNQRRERTMRSLLATLAFSLGAPMLSHGDEHARTQSGNNNPWCQDNALAWVPWSGDARAMRMERFVGEVLALRRRYGVFRRTNFLHVMDHHDARSTWLTRHGTEMSLEDWKDGRNQLLVTALQTGIGGGPASHGWVLLALNAGEDAVVTLPPLLEGADWRMVLDTAAWPGTADVGNAVVVAGGSLVLLEAAGA